MDKLKSTSPLIHDTLHGNNATTNSTQHNTGKWGNGQTVEYPRKRLTVQESIELKRKTQCKTCGLYGHWSSDHLEDGNIRFNFPSSNTPIIFTNNTTNNWPGKGSSDSTNANAGSGDGSTANSGNAGNTMCIGNANMLVNAHEHGCTENDIFYT